MQDHLPDQVIGVRMRDVISGCIFAPLPDKRILPRTLNGVINNYSHHENRRVDISVGTDYGANLTEVRTVLETVAAKVPNGLTDPAPQVFLAALGGSSIDWKVRVWTNSDNYWQVFQDGTNMVKDALDVARLGIPFPQMDVHLDKFEA